MSEPEYPPLGPEDSERLASAVSFWAGNHPSPDYQAFAFAGEQPFSPNQLAEALSFREGPLAEAFLQMARFSLEVESLDSLIDRFHRAAESGGPRA